MFVSGKCDQSVSLRMSAVNMSASNGHKTKTSETNKNEHNPHPRHNLEMREFKYRHQGDVPTLAEVCDVGCCLLHRAKCCGR